MAEAWRCSERTLTRRNQNVRCVLPRGHESLPTAPAKPWHAGKDTSGLWHYWDARPAVGLRAVRLALLDEARDYINSTGKDSR